MYLKGREDVQGAGHSVGCRAVPVPSVLPASGSLQYASLRIVDW